MYKLLVGLGNPGKKHQLTRHNLGGLLVSNFAQKHHIKLSLKPSLKANIAQIGVGLPRNGQGDSKIILAIPTTYMNLSGLAVAKIVNFYKIEPKNLYIAHDDLDIRVGDSKIIFDRGPAGHNGIRSIIKNLGTQAFWRIRIGIDHPQDNIPIEDYVLMPPSKDEMGQIDQTIDKIIDQVSLLFKN